MVLHMCVYACIVWPLDDEVEELGLQGPRARETIAGPEAGGVVLILLISISVSMIIMMITIIIIIIAITISIVCVSIVIISSGIMIMNFG